MVSVAPSRLSTRVGFRRDIRLFFGLLAVFDVALIVVLVATLQSTTHDLRETSSARWESAADAAVAELRGGGSGLQGSLQLLRERYDIAGVKVATPGSGIVESGYTADDTGRVVRQLPTGSATFYFDTTTLHATERRASIAGSIAIAAALIASLLLFLYVPRIVRPFEELLEAAGEIEDPADHDSETDYLVTTFRRSVTRLRGQELELKRLHDAERARADDLQRVTGALTRSLTSGFIAIDPAGTIVDMNAAAREILQLDPDTAPGALEETLGASAFSGALRESLDSREAAVRQEVAVTRGESEVAIGVTTVPLVSENDAFLGMLAIFTDLTPIRTLERRVRDMQTLADLGEISAGIAHEFRNSLATVTGYLTLAQRDELPDATRQRIANAAAEAAQLSGAVQRFLTFARPMEISLQPLDVRALLETLAAAQREHADAIEIAVEGDALVVDADPVLLPRAFDNLLRNAVESVQESGRSDGRVTITIASVPPSVTIDDNGAGVDSRDVPRLFLPFQSTKSAGFGLGLSLVRKIVLLHGGEVSLTGAPGAGARARVTFAE